MLLIHQAEVIEVLKLNFITAIQEAMALVHHVLLAPPGVLEVAAAGEAEEAQVDSLADVGHQPLQVYQAVHIHYIERVS